METDFSGRMNGVNCGGTRVAKMKITPIKSEVPYRELMGLLVEECWVDSCLLLLSKVLLRLLLPIVSINLLLCGPGK